MSFDKWKKRMEIAALPTVAARRAATPPGFNNMVPDHEDEGYYRKPVSEKDPKGNGRNIIKDWIPVAIFLDRDDLVMVTGSGDARVEAALDDVESIWQWCVSNPISFEIYQAVAENGKPWPDLAAYVPPVTEAAAPESPKVIPTGTEGRTVAATDNQNSVDQGTVVKETIETVLNAARELVKRPIDSDEQASTVLSTRNRINELKNEAEKIKEKLFRPHKERADAVTKEWLPIIQSAENAGKALWQVILKHEQKKRDAAAAAQKVIDDEAARVAAINERAADRAIVRGEEPPAPLVVEEAKVTTPAPKAQIQAAYGRAAAVQEKTFVVLPDDLTPVLIHYKNHAAVRELMQKLAQVDVTAGLTVPGTTTRRGVI